jgi:hypothetical protein
MAVRQKRRKDGERRLKGLQGQKGKKGKANAQTTPPEG